MNGLLKMKRNEMTFGINNCDTLVVKPINFVKPINYEDPSFFIGSNKLPIVTNYLKLTTILILVFLLINLYH